jgi:hypothetical protein
VVILSQLPSKTIDAVALILLGNSAKPAYVAPSKKGVPHTTLVPPIKSQEGAREMVAIPDGLL